MYEEVYYWEGKNEVDFVCRKDNDLLLYNVSCVSQESEIKERELKGFVEFPFPVVGRYLVTWGLRDFSQWCEDKDCTCLSVSSWRGRLNLQLSNIDIWRLMFTPSGSRQHGFMMWISSIRIPTKGTVLFVRIYRVWSINANIYVQRITLLQCLFNLWIRRIRNHIS